MSRQSSAWVDSKTKMGPLASMSATTKAIIAFAAIVVVGGIVAVIVVVAMPTEK